MPTIAEPNRRIRSKRRTVPVRQPEPKQQYLVYGATWGMYEKLLQQFEGRHIRLTFNGENLEIMSVSEMHEFIKKLIARLVEIYALEADIPLRALGNITTKNAIVERGLEPDECYYVQHAEFVYSLGRPVDFAKDPPPDVVLEVEVSRSILDRMEIYAKLRVPEVWRCGECGVQVCLLRRGKYVEAKKSLAFPGLPIDEFNRFLAKQGKMSDHALVRSFRDWVKAELLGEE